MALPTLVDKASKTTSSWWKWILGILVAIGVGFVAWKIRRQRTEVSKLFIENIKLQERIKDIETEAKSAKHEETVQTLLAEAGRLERATGENKAKLVSLREIIKEAQKRIDSAKKWQALERERDQ